MQKLKKKNYLKLSRVSILFGKSSLREYIERVGENLAVQRIHVLLKLQIFLQDLGYKFSWSILNLKNFGLPQNRERFIGIGVSSKYYSNYFDFDSLLNKSNNKSLADFINSSNGVYLIPGTYVIFDKKNWAYSTSGLIFCGYIISNLWNLAGKLGSSSTHRQTSRIYSVNGINPTIRAGDSSGRYYIYDNIGVRKLTLNECYTIQGFSRNFIKSSKQTKAYSQIGNSISPVLVRSIKKELYKQQFLSFHASPIRYRMSGRDIAIGGLRREKEICDLFNTNLVMRDVLRKKVFLNKIGKFGVVKGSKSDISDTFFNTCQSKKSTVMSFNQLHRCPISSLLKKLPQLKCINFMLGALCVKPLTKEGVVDKNYKRLPLKSLYYRDKDLQFLLKILKKNKREILEYTFLGKNSKSGPKILVISGSTLDRLTFFAVKDIIEVLLAHEFKIRKSGTVIELGPWFTIQRKGGDKGLKSSNDIAFKLDTKKIMHWVNPIITHFI
jgi:hypothetical protein